MSEEEILKKMKQLLYKIRLARNSKLKKFYIFDLITLIQFLEISYGKEVTTEELLFDDIYEDIAIIMEEENINSVNEFIDVNDVTMNLANECINTFNKMNFVAYYNQFFPNYKTAFLEETLLEFLNSLDNKSLKEYSELLKQGIIISEIGDSFAGACFNLYSENKQMVNISSLHYMYGDNVSEIGFFSSIAHEVGHAVHLNLINESVRNKNYTTVFTESISMMYEKMYLNFLKRNGIDITPDLRNEYYTLLHNSMIARGGALSINDGFLYSDFTIPGMYFTNEYFDKYQYLLDEFYGTTYDALLPYFYGELIATKFMDDFGDDYKNCTKSLLEVLMKSESSSSLSLLNEINLTSIPKGVAKGIRDVNNPKKKVKL